MKMVISDRRIALVPLSFLGPSSIRARILVHSSPLLDALVMCFEFLWSLATPIVGGPAGPITLGVAERTVGRRAQELMAQLQATTRFQAGLQAARRSWL